MKTTAAVGSGGSRPGVWGAPKCLHMLNTKGYLRQSLCVTQKRLSFVGQKVAILLVELCYFQGIITVSKRFISLIQKTFETGPRQWASFFTSYTDIVYLQNVFKSNKSMLRASVCQCFGYPQRNQ